MPISRTSPNTDVSHGPRTGLFHRARENGPSSPPGAGPNRPGVDDGGGGVLPWVTIETPELGAREPGDHRCEGLHRLARHHDVGEAPPLAALQKPLTQFVRGADQDDRKLERVLTRKAEHGCGARGSAAAGYDLTATAAICSSSELKRSPAPSRTHAKQRS